MTRSGFDRLIHLRKRAHSLRIGLLSRLGEFASDFPSGTPVTAIELIKKILVAAAKEIDSSSDERFLEQTCRGIQALGHLLAFFDNAHTAQTPRAVTEMVDQLMTKLQPGSMLMVWPQGEFNYSIWDTLPWLKALTEHFLPTPDFEQIFDSHKGAALNLVSFPRIERDNVLLHAILGHELGHPIADKFLNGEKGTKKYSEGFHRAIGKLTSAGEHQGDETEVALDSLRPTITRLLELRARGLQELISDSVGVLLFGFSAIFANYDVLSVNVLDALPGQQMYPPRRFRLRLQYNVLNQTGHVEAVKSLRGLNSKLTSSVKNFLNHLEGLISKDQDRNNLKTDRIISAAYDWIEETLDDAVAFAIKEVGALTYDAARVKEEVPELIERIDLGLPPNEIGKFPEAITVDSRSAILAAWLYRLHGERLSKDKGDPKLTPGHLDSLNRLTLKAIEYTTLHREYATFKAAP